METTIMGFIGYILGSKRDGKEHGNYKQLEGLYRGYTV